IRCRIDGDQNVEGARGRSRHQHDKRDQEPGGPGASHLQPGSTLIQMEGCRLKKMLLRALLGAVVALLVAASPALALSKTETASSGQVTASLSYNYKQARYGTCCFENVSVTIDRAGQRLVDQKLGGECEGCTGFPAGSAQSDSIRVRDLDDDGEPEVLVDLYTGGPHCCFYTDV